MKFAGDISIRIAIVVIYCSWQCLLGCCWNRRRCFVNSKSDQRVRKMCLEITRVLQPLGMDFSEMGISGSQVMVLPLLCSAAPGKTFLLCVFLPSLHLVCWGEGFLLGNTVSTYTWEAGKGSHSEQGAELKPGRLLPNSCSTTDSGDPGRVTPFFLSMSQCCEDKYLKGCEALECDGCRGLRNLTSCTCGYSLLTGLVCCAKYKKPFLHTVRPQFHLQLAALSRKHLTDQLESVWGTGLMWNLGCSAVAWG